MKKLFIALMLCIVSIVILSCENAQSSGSDTQNVNVKVSEGTDEWECLGEVMAFSVSNHGDRSVRHNGTCAWVKQIGGQTHYQAGWGDSRYPLIDNPEYGQGNNDINKARYYFVKDGGNIYVIL